MTWLIALFAPRARAEAIVGDLVEEFGELSARDGHRAARRWLWRQSLRSAWHLAVGQTRSAPWPIAGWALVLLVAFNLVEIPTELGARFLVTHYPVYHIVPAAWFWLAVIAIQRYGVPIVLGACLARLARERAILAVIAMAAAVAVWAQPAVWTRTLPPLKVQLGIAAVPTFFISAARATLLLLAGTVFGRVMRRTSVLG